MKLTLVERPEKLSNKELEQLIKNPDLNGLDKLELVYILLKRIELSGLEEEEPETTLVGLEEMEIDNYGIIKDDN